jgi:nuclear transport factor 2 (NTF2) superfamily protein
MLALQKGDRVQVVGHHPWMANRYGVVKNIEASAGNRFLVKFNHDESGTWHDDDGVAVLLLGEGLGPERARRKLGRLDLPFVL